MSAGWSKVSLGELIRLERRPVEVRADELYPEIGIYCFGRGIFHKLPRMGLEVGDKSLFALKSGDLILQVTFAWEGAVALVSDAENGMYGSTRYPTFRVDETRCFPSFLVNYFKTEEGLQQLIKISPGSAGRNRVLSLKRIPEVMVPLPPIEEQQEIIARVEALAAEIERARTLRQQATKEAEALVGRCLSASLDDVGWERKPLGNLLVEPPKNGLSPKPELEVGGKPMLRINSVSSAPTRFVDLAAVKYVDVTEDEFAPYRLRNDDVFIVRYNGDINRVARPAIFKTAKGYIPSFPDKLMRLRPDKEKMTPDFLVFALMARSVRAQVEALGKTTAGNIGISGGNAKGFVVPLPPLPEQHRIVAELDKLQAGVDRLKVLQAETAAEIDALLPAILDRAFRGELR